MESKKMFATAGTEESTSGRPSLSLLRPLSPLRTGRLARRRSSQTTSSFSVHEGVTAVSCVTRETSQEDCARHRFIVWAAVKRNTCTRITSPEKLECPLFRCRRRFPDHETMLRHLAACEYLPSGEYLCYEHMRVERFDDAKCKRCLGHPSKRRKMLSMAKNFFQSLGHKSRKGSGFEYDEYSDCPPSYDSLIGSGGLSAELSATEIAEIDSTEIEHPKPTHENASDSGIDPQALLIPELDSTAVSFDSFLHWSGPASQDLSNDFTSAGQEECRNPLSKPALQLTTHGLSQYRKAPRPPPRQAPSPPRSNKGLSPSSSVRSTTSTTSTDSTDSTDSTTSMMSTATTTSVTSNVSSLISPVSAWSGAWSLKSGGNTNLTTPVDLLSPNNAFLSEAPFGEDCQAGYIHDMFSELPADYPGPVAPQGTSADALFYTFDTTTTAAMPYATDIVLTDDLTTPRGLPEAELHESNICCSEIRAMVGSAWDTLQEHIASSVRKIHHMENNPLADRLRSLSIRSIALSGLGALKGLLNGQFPTSADEILSFIHLIYAFSLVVHEDEAATRSRQLFIQALSYTTHFVPEERESYAQIVLEIWQPSGISQAEVDRGLSQLPHRSLSRKGKQPERGMRQADFRRSDALLSAARDFLDELESCLVFGDTPSTVDVLTSDLYSKHLQDLSSAAGNTSFTVTVNFVVTVLIQDFSDVEGLIAKLSGIHHRVADGSISSVRRAELELLQAAKGCIAPSAYFDRFAPTVRRLCDPIYQQNDSGASGRDSYYVLGASLVEGIITLLDTPSVQISLPVDDEPDALENFFDGLTPSLDPDAMAQFVDAECLLDLPMDEIDLEAKPSDDSAPSSNGLSNELTAPRPPNGEGSGQSFGQPQPLDQAQQQLGKVEADACCELCGYRPKGDPQWFKGSMAKHKKLQHSTAPPKIYKCPFPGCASAYKNRPDNLRQHQIEKGHFVSGEAVRRPSKRKKIAEEED